MTLPPELRSKQGIEEWAKRYLKTYREADRDIQETVRSALARRTDCCATGHLKKAELLKIVEWMKGWRNLPRVRSNREIDVNKRTHRAFADENHEPLMSLQGVGLTTALAIMHLAFPNKYPMIGAPALRTLRIEAPYVSRELWYDYQTNCLAWANEYGVCLRTLDRALWQYGKGW